MTDKKLWEHMDKLASEKRSREREAAFMLLLKFAYDEDMKLILSCFPDPEIPGAVRQGYMDVMGKRLLVCFTSKQRADRANYNTTWDVARARDLMNNMFNKNKIMGMVFNPDDENMVIVLKELLLPIMPGEKPKPEYYRE